MKSIYFSIVNASDVFIAHFRSTIENKHSPFCQFHYFSEYVTRCVSVIAAPLQRSITEIHKTKQCTIHSQQMNDVCVRVACCLSPADENGEEESEEPPKPVVREIKEKDSFFSQRYSRLPSPTARLCPKSLTTHYVVHCIASFPFCSAV